ncbi:hypothetical protein GOBAR_AA31409 [Gossypium barbadense]|uniref:Uncharacterized protein n=1 Tax=Gossypium barbadense TaxID=3634 RepID=A0A2P5WDV0_GOSBA|nr:hypothetical protein GOBAR_AA31409 [Gossypium barbadense]
MLKGDATRGVKGQLGHGDTIQRDRPTIVSEFLKYKIIKAGAGRSHTVVVTEDGNSLAFGWNKHGQLGSGSTRNVTNTACGAEFTVWLSATEGASILTAGLPQYGQLGHGTDNEFSNLVAIDLLFSTGVCIIPIRLQYNAKDSSVRLVYESQPRPRAIATLSGETIVKVACGTNHTVAVDMNGYVFTWGFGGYGRFVTCSPLLTSALFQLGHREQKDEWVPRRIEVFQKHNVLPPNAVVSAGSVNSACTAGGGQLYMWGKLKNTGDDWMYPKPLMDLSGWNLRCMDSGNMFHFVGADSSCISWGHAQYGELGYGPTGQKSSAIPRKVDILEGMHVISVACGMGHSMVIVDRTNVGDRLDQLEIYDGKGSDEGTAVSDTKTSVLKQNNKNGASKTPTSSKKRKKAKDESETEEENSDVESDSSGGHINGEVSGKGRGKGAKKTASVGKGKGRGQGNVRANKSSQSSQGKTSKRGRLRKV